VTKDGYVRERSKATVEELKFSLDIASIDDIQRVLGHGASDPLHLPI
jgi:hypothetical protein